MPWSPSSGPDAVEQRSYSLLWPTFPSAWLAQEFVQLRAVETHDRMSVDHGHRHGPKALLSQFVQSIDIRGHVALGVLHTFLGKILFHLITEHSPRLGVDDDLSFHASVLLQVLSLDRPLWERQGAACRDALDQLPIKTRAIVVLGCAS